MAWIQPPDQYVYFGVSTAAPYFRTAVWNWAPEPGPVALNPAMVYARTPDSSGSLGTWIGAANSFVYESGGTPISHKSNGRMALYQAGSDGGPPTIYQGPEEVPPGRTVEYEGAGTYLSDFEVSLGWTVQGTLLGDAVEGTMPVRARVLEAPGVPNLNSQAAIDANRPSMSGYITRDFKDAGTASLLQTQVSGSFITEFTTSNWPVTLMVATDAETTGQFQHTAVSTELNGSARLETFVATNSTIRAWYRPPRWRLSMQGMWNLRQRQSLTGNAGGWPLRQRQNGGATGSWPLRQRQTGT